MGSVIAIAVLLTLVSLELLFLYIVLKSSLPIFENMPPFAAEQYPQDPSAEPIAFRTPSGMTLRGSLFRTLKGEPRGLIVFCHELGSNRWSALSYCEGLLAAGFHVLAFDFRNHGESDWIASYDPICWLSAYEVEDVMAVIEFIGGRTDLNSLPLGLFGMSRGGAAALVAASTAPSVRCVCADGAYSCDEMLYHFTRRWGALYIPGWMMQLEPRWHMLMIFWLIRTASQFRRRCRYANVERSLDRLRDKPVLMFSGERDTYVTPRVTRSLFARTGQDESNLWIVPRAKHNTARQTATDQYDRRMIEFFSLLEDGEADRQPTGDGMARTNGQAFAGRPVRPSELTAG